MSTLARAQRFPARLGTVTRVVLFGGLEAIVVLAIVAATLHLWWYGLRVPFNYRGDTLWFATVVKGLVQNGWTFEIPQLSAPFSLHAVAYPSITTFDWALMKLIALFSSDAGFILNTFWLLSLVLTAWTGSAALVLVGVSIWLGFLGGVVYALLPFTFIRNVHHINLVYYTAPLLCLLAINVARGGYGDSRDVYIRRLGYLGAFVQGSNYIYFSFFGVLLLGIAALIAVTRRRKPGVLRAAVVAIGILAFVSAANLAPSFYSWSRDGKPELDYKVLAEAEVYGLKIRKMVSPHPDNPLPLLGAWGRRDTSARFPNENENVAARLGIFATLGLILMLAAATSMVRCRDRERLRTLHSTATLGLATLLISTVGGFGAVINVLTTPDIRGYNRFAVFLAFFAIASLCLWVTALIRPLRPAWRRNMIVIATVGILALSVFDQLLDAAPLAQRRATDVAAAGREEKFLRRLEEALPAGAAIFQLPITPFPPDPGMNRMLPYDHARPNLWSTKLRWSWPSFSQRHGAWLDRLEGKSGEELAHLLVLSGFDAIWVDRFGLWDEGDSMIDNLRNAGAQLLLEDDHNRYVVLDLRPAAQSLKATLGPEGFRAESMRLLNEPVIEWGKGFNRVEMNPEGLALRWSQARSELKLYNYADEPREMRLSFLLQAKEPSTVVVHIGDERQVLQATAEAAPGAVDVLMPPGGSRRIQFLAAVERMMIPVEEKDAFFAVIDPKVSSTGSSRKRN